LKKIAIFGPPRSGTSWLSHIFNSHPDVVMRFQPLFSYGHKGGLTSTSNAQDVERFFDEILHSKDPYALMMAETQKGFPVFSKSQKPTHIVFKETRYLNVIRNILETSPDVTVIGIIRHPLSTLASWYGAPKEFSPDWDFNDEWRKAQSKNKSREEEYFGFDKWKESAYLFMEFKERYQDNFKLIKYDSLNSNPEMVIQDIFNFCELSLDQQTHKFIQESQSRNDSDPYSVYRIKKSDDIWKNILPPSIVKEVVMELQNSTLKKFL